MLIAPKWLKIRTSNLACMPQRHCRHDPEKFFRKGAWQGSRDPLNFCALNANSSKIVKDTNFKFGIHAPRESPDMTAENFFEKGAWPESRDPLIFWALNANSSKMTEDTNFRFGAHAPRESPDDPRKISSKRGRGQGHVTL